MLKLSSLIEQRLRVHSQRKELNQILVFLEQLKQLHYILKRLNFNCDAEARSKISKIPPVYGEGFPTFPKYDLTRSRREDQR